MVNNMSKFIIGVGVLVVIIIGGFYIYEQLFLNDRVKTTESDNKTSLISKKFSDKDYVYDASYDYDIDSNSYVSLSDNVTYSVDDIKVAYINVDSLDCNKVNNEIKGLFDDLVKDFKVNLEDKVWFVSSSYKWYINDDKLYVVIEVKGGSTYEANPRYYTYGIDLKSGDLIDYKDAYVSIGYTKDSIDTKLEELVLGKLKGNNFESDDELMKYVSKNMDIYNSLIDSDDREYRLGFYFDENNKFNIVTYIVSPISKDLKKGEQVIFVVE